MAKRNKEKDITSEQLLGFKILCLIALIWNPEITEYLRKRLGEKR